MRKNTAKEWISGLIASIALLAILICAYPLSPSLSPAVHAAIGQAMAKETLKLLSPGDRSSLLPAIHLHSNSQLPISN